MKRRHVLVLPLLAALSPARAGMADLFNGVALGKPLPAHAFDYLGGAPETQGKLLLIDFWATWCEACRHSVPRLNRLHAQHAGDGLVVVGLSQEPPATIAPVAAKLGMDYPVAADREGALHAALRIRALPYAILVDRSGTIVWRGQPEALADETVAAALAGRPA